MWVEMLSGDDCTTDPELTEVAKMVNFMIYMSYYNKGARKS
jgi:hypothetical protein